MPGKKMPKASPPKMGSKGRSAPTRAKSSGSDPSQSGSGSRDSFRSRGRSVPSGSGGAGSNPTQSGSGARSSGNMGSRGRSSPSDSA
jgi:hypothetical protein